MIQVSSAFKEEIYKGNIKYIKKVDITLNTGQTLHIEDKDIWQGGLSIDDAVSNDNSFDVGAAIINQCTVTLNNIYNTYSEYDFDNAEVVPFVGLELPDGTVESFRKGTFHVTDTKYNGSLITLTCLDNMDKFDKKYSLSKLSYPATLAQIVKNACSVCGVSLLTTSIPWGDFLVQEKPNGESTTFREVLQWCAQIAGCFCRCDTFGRLELKWYDQDTLMKVGLDGGYFDDGEPYYTSGDNADGGHFIPWRDNYSFDGGDFYELEKYHHIYSNYSCEISTNDVVITGVKVLEKNKEESDTVITTYEYGNEGYVISIENNELIKDGSGRQVADRLGQQFTGFRFRKATVQHTSNPTIEAGDIGFLTDKNENTYPIIISSTVFSSGSSQKTLSSAETPSKTNVARYSQVTKNYVAAQEQAKKASGLYETLVEQEDGSTIRYYHDKRKLEESSIRMVFNTDGFQITGDGGEHWYGMKVDGDFIANILEATGIIADWIIAGLLKSKDYVEDEKGVVFNLDNSTITSYTTNKNGDRLKIEFSNAGVFLTDIDDETEYGRFYFDTLGQQGIANFFIGSGSLGRYLELSARGFSYSDNNNKTLFSVSSNGGLTSDGNSGKTGRAEFSDGSYLEFTNGILTGGQTASGGQIT